MAANGRRTVETAGRTLNGIPMLLLALALAILAIWLFIAAVRVEPWPP